MVEFLSLNRVGFGCVGLACVNALASPCRWRHILSAKRLQKSTKSQQHTITPLPNAIQGGCIRAPAAN